MTGKTENEHVRVINHITSSRVLLKGFEGKVMCLAFGGPTEDHIACMDILGNLRIFLISEGSQGLEYPFLFAFRFIRVYRRQIDKVAQ